MEIIKISGRKFTVLEYIEFQNSVTIPLLDIRMMDERRDRELADQSAARWKEVGL